MWLFAVGLGFSISWLWSFFLNGPLLAAVSAKWSEDAEMIFLVFLLFHSLSFLLTAFWLSRAPSLAKNRRMLVTAALLMSGGTLATGFIPGEPLFDYRWPINMLSAAAAGLGSAPLMAAWGEACSTRPLKEAGLVYSGGIIVSTVLFFLGNMLDITPGVLLSAAYPLLSLALYLAKEYPQSASEPVEIGLRCPLPGKLVVLLALFYLASGFMHKIIYAVDNLPLLETYWLTNAIYCCVGLLAGASTYLRPDIDLRLLYRPALPLLGAGFVLFPFLADIYELLPFALLQSGFALFDVYTWLLFIYLGAQRQASGYMVSWGMFFLTLASFCGELLSNALASIGSLTLRGIDTLSLCAALVMFLTTLIFQDERETFAGWRAIPKAANKALSPESESIEIAAAVPTTAATDPVETQDIATEDPIDTPQQLFWLRYGLTARECEVASLLLKGRNNPFIREALNISDNTLKSHLRNIYRKLMVTNRQEVFSLFDEFKKDRAV